MAKYSYKGEKIFCIILSENTLYRNKTNAIFNVKVIHKLSLEYFSSLQHRNHHGMHLYYFSSFRRKQIECARTWVELWLSFMYFQQFCTGRMQEMKISHWIRVIGKVSMNSHLRVTQVISCRPINYVWIARSLHTKLIFVKLFYNIGKSFHYFTYKNVSGLLHRLLYS